MQRQCLQGLYCPFVRLLLPGLIEVFHPSAVCSLALDILHQLPHRYPELFDGGKQQIAAQQPAQGQLAPGYQHRSHQDTPHLDAIVPEPLQRLAHGSLGALPPPCALPVAIKPASHAVQQKRVQPKALANISQRQQFQLQLGPLPLIVRCLLVPRRLPSSPYCIIDHGSSGQHQHP